MPLSLDLHVHTSRYSACSRIDPERLIEQAIKAGLDGLVITEHHRQWNQEELDDLLSRADAPGFLLLAGFEYGSTQGDILVYGLASGDVEQFQPGWTPEATVEFAHGLGGVCIAAHPTRYGMGFDERILTIPFDAIEVSSVNLRDHEQRLAMQLAKNLGVSPMAASDAHLLPDVGRYATEFSDPIRSMPELQEALRHGRFLPRSNDGAAKVRKRWT